MRGIAMSDLFDNIDEDIPEPEEDPENKETPKEGDDEDRLDDMLDDRPMDDDDMLDLPDQAIQTDPWYLSYPGGL